MSLRDCRPRLKLDSLSVWAPRPCSTFLQDTQETLVASGRLRVAHPCAPSRSTVHPEHKGPEERYCTPSSLQVIIGQWILKDMNGLCRRLWWVRTYQDRERHGCRARAYMDVFTASPEKSVPAAASLTVVVKESCTSNPGLESGYKK